MSLIYLVHVSLFYLHLNVKLWFFSDSLDKIEIEMKEVKEKLSSLTASAEKSTQEG